MRKLRGREADLSHWFNRFKPLINKGSHVVGITLTLTRIVLPFCC